MHHQQPMLTGNTRITLKDVARHLASMGVSDMEVREGSHYAIGWLTAVASSNSSRPEESSIAADLVRRLRQHPNTRSEDAPLMSEPRWWVAGPNDVALREARRKRKRDPAAPIRGGAPLYSGRPRLERIISTVPSSGFSSGLSTSMHASAPRVDDMPPPLAGPSHGHGSTAPPQPESDPSGGWLFPVIVKPTPSQKWALKRAR